jgi:hypothetical protein
MYDMPSTPAYQANQKPIIALRPRGNNSESAKGSIWSVQSVWFIWFNQIDETDQINQIDLA